MDLRIHRVYEPDGGARGKRVLVDRVWPRGIKKESLHLDAWMPELGPSPALRRWFGHRPERWDESGVATGRSWSNQSNDATCRSYWHSPPGAR
jgi:uncharacterized protein YeaO (DUF488 family)